MGEYHDAALVEELLRTVRTHHCDQVDLLDALASRLDAALVRQLSQTEKLLHEFIHRCSEYVLSSPGGNAHGTTDIGNKDDPGVTKIDLAFDTVNRPRFCDAAKNGNMREPSLVSALRVVEDSDSPSRYTTSKQQFQALVPTATANRRFLFECHPTTSILESCMAMGTRYQDFVRSRTFKTISAIPQVLFCVLLGVETDHLARHGSGNSPVFGVCHMIFSVWFTIELMIRVVCLRWDIFSEDARMWNIFDIIMVLTSLVDMAILTLSTPLWQSFPSSKNFGVISRAFRTLRLVKILRLARMMGGVHELQKMVVALQACGMTLLWCVVLMYCVIFCFAILFTQAVADHRQAKAELSSVHGEDDEQLEEVYGNMLQSTLSLYAAMSNGISWESVLRPLLRVHWVYAICFLLFITFSIFGLLNVITSVFVESTVQSTMQRQELVIEEAQARKAVAIRHLRNIFRRMDFDGSGDLNILEMRQVLKDDPACLTYLDSCDISTAEIEKLFVMLDDDGSGSVSLDEFCEGCLLIKGQAKSFDVHCLSHQVNRLVHRFSTLSEGFNDMLALQEDGFVSLHRAVTNMAADTALLHKSVQAIIDQSSRLMHNVSGTPERGVRYWKSQSQVSNEKDVLSPSTESGCGFEAANELPFNAVESSYVCIHRGARPVRSNCLSTEAGSTTRLGSGE
eukprot:TRINITY_DN7115_c0_g1_i4.p1 TRINITY_DN7115_c0_g1~~TRINITY_DN7115_c0_g1_i4.p1  ORF type:complete len:681 (+),score=65.01 TRINITY_DN7115_c0_g1_i4:37-2079(+)